MELGQVSKPILRKGWDWEAFPHLHLSSTTAISFAKSKPFRAHLEYPWELLEWVMNPNSLSGWFIWQIVWYSDEEQWGHAIFPWCTFQLISQKQAQVIQVPSPELSRVTDEEVGGGCVFQGGGGKHMKSLIFCCLFFFSVSEQESEEMARAGNLPSPRNLIQRQGLTQWKLFSMLTKCCIMWL